MIDNKHWLFKIVPILAYAAGIIMASIGGIMLLSSVAKIVLINSVYEPYSARETCLYDYQSFVDIEGVAVAANTNGASPKIRSEAEVEKCILDEEETGRNNFRKDKNRGVIDGFSALVVGFILILFFRDKKNGKREKK